MGTSLLAMVGFSYFLIGMVVIASRHNLPLLAETNGILIISHVAIGVPMFSVFGTNTNVGAIFFAVLMFGLAVKYMQYGPDETRSGIFNIIFALIIELGSIMLLQEANVLSPMSAPRIRFAGVCIVAFWLTLSLFVAMLNRFKHVHPLLAIPPITIATEAFYGLIFYPAAYNGVVPLDEVVRIAVWGVVASTAVTIFSIPALAWVAWFGRQPARAVRTQ